jgi:RNA polymerase II subunit A-like phosphatase
MPSMKMRVLAGVVIVFSGVLPLGTNIQTADISTWAKTFGAKITDRVAREVTHVIAARAGTAKVKQAVKRGIKVVGTNWLISSIQQWRKLDERPYLLEGAGQKRSELTSSDVEKDIDKEHLTSHDFMLSSSDGEGSETGLGDTDVDGNGDDDDNGLFGDGDELNKQNGNMMKHTNIEADKSELTHQSHSDENNGPPRKKLKLNTNTGTGSLNGGTVRPDNASGEIGGISTDTDDELADEGSPITINQDDWDDMDAELKEFMGSEVDSESDNDSVSSKLSLREKRASIKRKREEDDSNEVDSRNGPGFGGGGSTLRSVRNIESPSLTPVEKPVTEQEISRDQNEEETKERREEAETEDSDDELARELERELEEGDEDDDDGGGL